MLRVSDHWKIQGDNPTMPRHGLREGPAPPPHPQAAEGIVKDGGSWRSAEFFLARFACDYITNII